LNALNRGTIDLVIGGARSGKSHHAEQRALESGLSVTYIATAEVHDDEMAERIAHHRARRPVHWQTREAPLALTAALRDASSANTCVLVDCLTLWLSNLMFAEKETEIGSLLDTLPTLPGRIILVSNEVGWGIVPENALARRFRDEQGRLNQRIAALADNVTLVAAGLPLVLKHTPPPPTA
jgi:adenosylcobinamide kinase/adenosylcobinamide-phosphate guanylyltransferase